MPAKKKSTVNSSGNYTKPGMRKGSGPHVKLKCSQSVIKQTEADINLRSNG